MAASRDLGAHALRLYLYLAANADGYKLALSPAAIFEAIGMPRSTYSDQFKILVAKGYLVANSRNGYDFFEVPKTRAEIEEIAQKRRTACGCAFEMETTDEHSMTARGQNGTLGMIEINNSQATTNERINTAGFGVPKEHQNTAFVKRCRRNTA